MMDKKFLFDSNALILRSDLLELEGKKIVPFIVLVELDKLKKGLSDTAYRARQVIRKLRNIDVYYDFEFGYNHPLLEKGNCDDLIIECAKKHSAVLITGDFNVELKAKSQDIKCFDWDNNEADEYSGFLEIEMTEEEIADFYQNLKTNKYNLLVNQYIIIRKNGELIDTAKWDGQQIQLSHHKGFKTNLFGQFKPLDEYQTCAIDSLSNNQLTMLKGKAGSGKSIIALNYAWSQIEKQKYDKLIIFTNPVASKNSAKLGFYPGTRLEKLLESQTGTMLASKFGHIMEVQRQISAGKLELLPFADIRGYDTTGMKAIIWFIECQNLDIELMKTGISRIGEDCKGILDGDYSGQVDMDVYAGYNNGMRRVSEVFRGNPIYGEVELKNVHRSRMAALASLL